MNKIKMLRNVFFLPILLASISSFGQDRVMPYPEMPVKVQDYIKTHFPKHKVVKAKIDRDKMSEKYEIKLDDGTDIEFNSQFKVVDIDGTGKLPESVIPQKINQYVKANYPNNFITDWELKKRHQKVELNNGMDLKFGLDGSFIKVDK